MEFEDVGERRVLVGGVDLPAAVVEDGGVALGAARPFTGHHQPPGFGGVGIGRPGVIVDDRRLLVVADAGPADPQVGLRLLAPKPCQALVPPCNECTSSSSAVRCSPDLMAADSPATYLSPMLRDRQEDKSHRELAVRIETQVSLTSSWVAHLPSARHHPDHRQVWRHHGQWSAQ